MAPARQPPPTPSALEDGVVTHRDVEELLGVVTDALSMRPPAWGRAVFGSPSSWVPSRFSEYGFAYSWRVLRAARYVADVAIPSLPMTAPAWFPEPVAPFFWHPSRVCQHADHNESFTSHRREAWLFVNGILTNAAMAELNVDYLVDLFHRPITLLENSTDGLLEDLVECAREKSFGRNAEATEVAFPAIYDALKDPEKERVVVIAHSQGTIIASAVLRLLALVYEREGQASACRLGPAAACAAARDSGVRLDPNDFEPLGPDELGKLELYCFANCSSSMRYVDVTPDGPLPWIESYANEFDLVARLGMLAPYAQKRGMALDGPRYVCEGAWGHLLNQHYLRAIDRAQRAGRRRGPVDATAAPYVLRNRDAFPGAEQPRLFAYINGGTPSAAGYASAVGANGRASGASTRAAAR